MNIKEMMKEIVQEHIDNAVIEDGEIINNELTFKGCAKIWHVSGYWDDKRSEVVLTFMEDL